MKIAVISDIHGNPLALDAVLKDIFSTGVDQIWCLGDIAMAGYDPNYTIEKIKFLTSKDSPVLTHCICGNTDLMVLNYTDTLFERILASMPAMAYALQDDVKIITPENKEFLSTLPQNERVVIDGISFYLCHGSPRKIDENIYPDTPLDVVEQIIESAESDVVLCGHTHIPCGFQLASGQTVLNDGSVGRPMNPDKRAIWALIDILSSDGVGEYEIIHKFVEYDNKQASKLILERGLKEAKKLADMLLIKE